MPLLEKSPCERLQKIVRPAPLIQSSRLFLTKHPEYPPTKDNKMEFANKNDELSKLEKTHLLLC